MYCAQINTNNICTSVSELVGDVCPINTIQLPVYDTSVLGKEYVNGSFVEVPPPPTPADPCEWLIDIGPFFDRFGASKMAILTSADAVVKAIIQDVQIRKWVDLKRVDVAQALDVLVAKGLITSGGAYSILNDPVTTDENRALRKLYF